MEAAEVEMEAAEAEVEMEAEAERKSDGDGEYEAGKKTPMRRLRGNVEHSDAEVAERQKRMKQTHGHLDDKEGEEARKGDIKREGQSESEKSRSESNDQKKKLMYERYLEWKRRNEEKEEEERRRYPDMVNDPEAYQAMLFRQSWDNCYLKKYGSFDKKTNIPCKRFTHNLPPRGGTAKQTIQVFYVKVGGITGGLQWPLEVFGLVALRDSLDYNRNIIFERKRDKCQILTDQVQSVSYLQLSFLDYCCATYSYISCFLPCCLFLHTFL